jgi:Malectin domain
VPTPVPSSAVLDQPLRINAGGADYRDSSGLVWLADRDFTGGTAFSSPGPIVYTNAEPLFSTQRVGDFTYKVPVKNGLWAVTFKFSELVFNGAGQRIFDVYLNNVLVSKNYDIVARSGGKRVALNQGISLTVTSGYIEVKLASVKEAAVLNGLELIPVSLNGLPSVIPPITTPVIPVPVVPVPVPVVPPVIAPAAPSSNGALAGPLRVNAGGAQYTDGSGMVWLTDQYFTGGTAFVSSGPIVYTAQTDLYNSQRSGNFTYRIPVRNGLWALQLKFAELIHTAANKRVFDVYVNGVLVSKSYDVVARAGGARVALNQGLTVDVNSGYIEIRFQSGVDNAVLNGLELLPVKLY